MVKVLKDYVEITRLHRPIGVYLVLWPAYWGLLVAKQVSIQYLVLFALGAVVMRSAGCIYNDMVDRKFDGSVTRTMNRPLVRKDDPLPMNKAVLFLGINLLIGFLILVSLPFSSILIGLIAVPLIFTYPWMKRITYWPQLFLGFTFNFGFLISWSTHSSLSGAGLLMYGGAILWTLGYDTIYGHMDADSDLLIGVKSTSLKLGAYTHIFLSICYGFCWVLWALSGYILGLGFAYVIGMLFVAGLFIWQIATLNVQNPTNCLMRFKSNNWVGVIIILSILVARL